MRRSGLDASGSGQGPVAN